MSSPRTLGRQPASFVEARSRSGFSPRLVLIAGAVVFAYILSARLGFSVAFVADQVTTVWPPTGIAQAALILWGTRLWPAIWFAAFVSNVMVGAPLWVLMAIATGNTVEALVAAHLLARSRVDPALDRTRDVLAFIVIAVVGATTVGATIGAVTLCAGGLQPWSQIGAIWADWWLGDSLGSLVFAPVLLTTIRSRARVAQIDLLEMAAWVIVSTVGTAIAFRSAFTVAGGQFPVAFTIFPFVITAAVTRGQPTTALVIVGTVVVTLVNTIRGIGPFTHNPAHEALILAQVFTGVLAASGLLLAAAITERRLIERRRAAVYGVGKVLATAPSLSEAATPVLRVIGEHLGWQVGALWMVNRAADRLHCIAVWCRHRSSVQKFVDITKTLEFTPGIGLPGRVLATGQAVWIEDVVEDANFPRAPIARREDLHSAFGFPISAGDRVIGAVEFFNRQVEAPDTDLLEAMATIGAEIGHFVLRKQMEAAAAENQSRTRAILDTALDAVITMDNRGLITEFNPAAEAMFGYRVDEVIGRELAEIIIPQGLRESHRNGLRRFLESGRGPFVDRRIDTTALRRDGLEFPVEISITKVATSPLMFTGFIRDVTARVAAERERNLLLEREHLARQQAEAANRAKDVFLATLSHELRTPLNAIVGWTRMLVDGTLDETTAARALQIIDRNAQAQLQLVEDILDVSRIVTGKLRLDVQPVDLGAIIGAVVDSVRPAADAKRIRLRLKISTEAQVIPGDPKRLQQVMWNLLSNALKFTDEGGSVEVDVADAGKASVRITVTDDGAGIPPEFIPYMFQRFSQADSSTTRRYGGLGLGLAIVKHLVELHGGTVTAESRGRGTGATFIVELPKLAGESAGAPSPLPHRSSRPARDAAPLAGCRVLVVEDETDAQELLRKILAGAGAEIEVAASVEQALTLLERGLPDVLLSDIAFAGEDGYTLIRSVRKRQGKRYLPAAAVTAFAGEAERQRAHEAGFDAYVVKPIDEGIVITVQALRGIARATKN